MSQAPPVSKNSTPVLDKSKAAKKDPRDQGRPQGPNEETFWTKYSPHYEFPLSSIASLVAHAVIVVLFIAIFAKFWFKGNDDPLPLDMVIAGGGGNPQGVGNGPGDGIVNPTKTENVDNPDNKVTDKAPDQTPELTKPDAPLKLPELTDSGKPVAVSPSVQKALSGIRADAAKDLLGQLAGKGKGGPGDGGGKGRGHGRGEGDLSGDGKQTANIRQQRVLRWTMKFNTFDGDDYRKQLNGLGAIMAVSDGKGGYLVVRDLEHVPVKAEAEDLRSIRRIFWIDSNPQSVASLAEALRMQRPREFIAFFPESLERELLEKELAYKGLQEQDIAETIFEIKPGNGRYVPFVVDQKRK
jgi:hypothetical protein